MQPYYYNKFNFCTATTNPIDSSLRIISNLHQNVILIKSQNFGKQQHMHIIPYLPTQINPISPVTARH